MSLRRRLTVAGGGAVFVALAIASLVIYFAVRSNLYDQIDVSLLQSAQDVAVKWSAANASAPVNIPSGKRAAAGKLAADEPLPADGPVFGSDGPGYLQVIPNLEATTKGELPLTGQLKTPLKQKLDGFVPAIGMDASVARGLAPSYFRDVRYRGLAMALYTMHLPSTSDGLVRTARPLTEANATIARVRWLLLALTLGGALAAGLLGRLAANAVLRPLERRCYELVERERLAGVDRPAVVGGLDEIADQDGELSGRSDGCCQYAFALFGG